jgi:uncharacterized protein with PIN domain
VDKTAGRLARWLRILGLDTEYADTCDAAVIVCRARQTGRMVVTRNRSLARRLAEGAILLWSEHLEAQLRQVVDEVGCQGCKPFSRCSACNAGLVQVDRESVRGRVPAYVYRNQSTFAVCPVCGRYYWRGTHWNGMRREIDKVIGGGHDGVG